MVLSLLDMYYYYYYYYYYYCCFVELQHEQHAKLFHDVYLNHFENHLLDVDRVVRDDEIATPYTIIVATVATA